MPKILFIAEKPAAAQDIAAWIERHGAFGGGKAERRPTYFAVGDAKVSYCRGHLLELMDAEEYDAKYAKWNFNHLPFVPAEFKKRPRADKDGFSAKQLRALGALIGEADEIIHAGDAADEGQLIVSEVLDYFGCSKPVRRLWLRALNDATITKAMQSLKPDSEYRGLYEAAFARSIADWIWGVNMTRGCTIMGRTCGATGVISIGRVQTPTLGMIVEREKKIRDFKPKDFYTPWVGVAAQPAFRAKWMPDANDDRLDAEGYLTDAGRAEAIAAACRKAAQARVRAFSSEKKTESAPLPFSLSALQAHMSARFGFGVSDTLKIAQSLYDKKIASYPRTDSDYLPENQHPEAKSVLASLKGLAPETDQALAGAQVRLKSRAWNDKHISDHHAIVPLARTGALPTLSHAEMVLYQEIVKRFILQFWPVADYLETRIELECANETFAVSGKVWTAPAWKAAFRQSTDDEDVDDDADVPALPVVKKGDILPIGEAGFDAARTKPPKRFTEGTLITAMKRAHQFVSSEKLRKLLKDRTGIGTEATRANVVETLLKRNYVEKKGKELVPTAVGEKLISLLPSSVTQPDMTAYWQQKMDAMREGQSTHEPFLAEQLRWIHSLIPKVPEWFKGIKLGDGKPRALVEDTEFKCECGQPLRHIKGEYNWFFGCADKEKCNRIYKDIDGKPVAPPPVTMTNHSCPGCGKGKLSQRKGQYGPYFHCEHKACGMNFKDVDGQPDFGHPCPKCKKGRLGRRDGSKGPFWSCNRYNQGCKHTANDVNGQPESKQ